MFVYSHPDPKVEGWPYKGYDYEGRKKELTAKLQAACPKVEFTPVLGEIVRELQPEPGGFEADQGP